MIVTDGGTPRRIDVPVEVPEGVNRETAYSGKPGMAGNFTNLPVNGRVFAARSVSTLSQTVTVTSESESLNLNSATDVVTVYKAEPPPSYGGGSRPKLPKKQVGGGGGGGAGGGGTDYSRVSTSPSEDKRQDALRKLHPSVLAVIDRLKDKKAFAGPDEAKFIRSGKAEIQIWLTEKSDETIAALKALGFEVVLDPKSAKLVIGRLPIEKLAALADLKSVRYVAPQM